MGKSALMDIQQSNGIESKRGWDTIKKPWKSSLRAERQMSNRKELGYYINVNGMFILLGLLCPILLLMLPQRNCIHGKGRKKRNPGKENSMYKSLEAGIA